MLALHSRIRFMASRWSQPQGAVTFIPVSRGFGEVSIMRER